MLPLIWITAMMLAATSMVLSRGQLELRIAIGVVK